MLLEIGRLTDERILLGGDAHLEPVASSRGDGGVAATKPPYSCAIAESTASTSR